MLAEKKIGFIGGGQMCEAIFAGAIASGAIKASNIMVTDILEARLETLAQRYGVLTVLNNGEGDGAVQVLSQCEVIVLSIKPQLVPDILGHIGGHFEAKHTVISIIGGIPLKTLEGYFPHSPVLRVLPNTPMLVGRGTAGICVGTKAKEEDISLCRQLFDAVGNSVILNENLGNAFTALSGAGPAYAYMVIEALAAGGVQQGLPHDLARKAAAEMVAGAAEMVLQTGQHPAQLRDNVCSPGGGTIAGVHALDTAGVRAAFMDAVAACRNRMDELGK